MTDLEVQQSVHQFGICVVTLGLRCPHGAKRIVSARIRNLKKPLLRGEVDVGFTLLNPTYGPEIECEDFIMKGYGIRFGNFKPWKQKFSFDSDKNGLRIEDTQNEEYDFVFYFEPV
jgi:hypothetical protein